MPYRCEATSVEGFVQQLACSYLRHGYWWYVAGRVPVGKDTRSVDAKLLAKYGVAVSESTRARRKAAGQANLQYLRFDRTFVLLATKGRHRFFDEEREAIRDVRQVPIRLAGYAVAYRRGGLTRAGEPDAKWHSHVAIERARYLDLKAHFAELARHRSAEHVALAFYRLPFEPYAPVRRQLLNLLREVNRVRREAGFAKIPTEVLPLRRRVVKPFGDAAASQPTACEAHPTARSAETTRPSSEPVRP